VTDIEEHVLRREFTGLAISLRHDQTTGALPGPHRDPLDRMLIAQAMLESLTRVSNEQPFDA